MNEQLKNLTDHYREVCMGKPWYGISLQESLTRVGRRAKQHLPDQFIFSRPLKNPHSAADLIYHILTWTEFARDRIARVEITDMPAFEALDWRPLDPAVHTWEDASNAIRSANDDILAMLSEKDDAWLDEQVQYREYDFRYLIRGITEHQIYHIGQLAYWEKCME